MTTSSNGSNYGNNTSGNTGWNTANATATANGTTNGTANTTATTNATATVAEPTCGTTYSVNEIPSPGCYVCHWNGSLLRVSNAAFTVAGFTSFNFTSSDPMTVTYLTNDPTATIEECRTDANGANVYANF